MSSPGAGPRARHRGDDRRRSLQPRHARGADAGGGAPLPRRVPERSARGRDPARALAADPARHHPAHAAGALGAQVRQHLDAGRLAAQGLDREAGACCSRAISASAATAVVVRYAMRYGTPSIASVLDAVKAAGADRVLVLPLYPQYAASTTASIGDARRGLDAARPQPARDPLRQALPRRPRLHRRARPARQTSTGDATAGPTSSCSASTACRGAR